MSEIARKIHKSGQSRSVARRESGGRLQLRDRAHAVLHQSVCFRTGHRQASAPDFGVERIRLDHIEQAFSIRRPAAGAGPSGRTRPIRFTAMWTAPDR